jgi:hypothetical protein
MGLPLWAGHGDVQMCALSILSFGSNWLLLDQDVWEIGQYETMTAALAAARSYLESGPGSAFVLIGGDEYGWREQHIEVAARH